MTKISARFRPVPMRTLSHDELLTLHDALSDAHLIASRDALLAGLPNEFLAMLPIMESPSAQVLSDLHFLNEAGTFIDGTSPLQMWLQNAAALTAPLAVSAVVRRILNRARLPVPPPGEPRHERARLLLSILAILIAILLLVIGRGNIGLPFALWSLFAIILFSLSGINFLLLYLKGDLKAGLVRVLPVLPPPEAAPSAGELRELRRSVANLEARLAGLSAKQDSPESGDMNALVSNLRQEVLSSLSEELEARLESRLQKFSHISAARRVFIATTRRLHEELASVTRRGNLNLAIGVVTTVAAVILLGYMVLKAPAVFDSLTALLSHYIPRLTTVVFIEVFSFFFLRLYRNGLSEMQYYQDQLTELARKEVALEASLATTELETQKHVISEIARMPPGPREHAGEVSLKDAGEFIERVGKVVVDATKAR